MQDIAAGREARLTIGEGPLDLWKRIHSWQIESKACSL